MSAPVVPASPLLWLPPTVWPLLAELSAALLARRWRLATAESCTGGLVAACCTSLAGSSDWFERGFVTYSNEAKTELLGVPRELIERHGLFGFLAVHQFGAHPRRGDLKYTHAAVAQHEALRQNVGMQCGLGR